VAENKTGISHKSLAQRVHQNYPDLPAGERKVADVVLKSPGDLALCTASELASLTGVSNATVSRLFRRLGYSNYDEARHAARQLRAQGSPLYLFSSPEAPRSRADFLSKHSQQEVNLIESSLATLNPMVVREVAELLATCKRVRFAGFRNSRFLADYATATLCQFRQDVERMNHPGQTLAEGVAGLSKGDVAVVLGLRRRPSFFNGFVKACASTGASVVLIADNSIREAPAYATYNITSAVDTPQLMDSYLGSMAIVRALLLAAVEKLGSEGRQYLFQIEALHEDLDELE
jgi:DNA-binding MurR/RpiR family transcriptional regulator